MKLKLSKEYIDIKNLNIIIILAFGSSYKKEYIVLKRPHQLGDSYWIKEEFIVELDKINFLGFSYEF